MEVMASIFALRSKHLGSTLETMLDEKTGDFFNHPLFQQLRYASSRRARLSMYNLPTYISKKTFTAILEDILPKNVEGDGVNLQALGEGRFKQMLQFLSREADGNAEKLKEKIGFWFDEIMERASEWYKGNIKWWLFGVGFGLACIFNVDTIQVYQTISSNATVQEQLVAMATDFVEKNDSIANPNLNLTLEESITRLDSSLQSIEHIRSPLGLGWSASEGKDLPWWLIKLAGLLLTGIAVTFGAPFWFDILKKLLTLGRGGSSEKNNEPKPEIAEKIVVVQPKSNDPKGTATGNDTSVATVERSTEEEGNSTPVG